MIVGNAPCWASEGPAVVDRRIDQLNRYPADEFRGLGSRKMLALIRIPQTHGQAIRVGNRQRSLPVHGPGIGGLIPEDFDFIQREDRADEWAAEDNFAWIILAVPMQEERTANPFDAIFLERAQLNFFGELPVFQVYAGNALDRYRQPIGVERHRALRTPERRDARELADSYILFEANAAATTLE